MGRPGGLPDGPSGSRYASRSPWQQRCADLHRPAVPRVRGRRGGRPRPRRGAGGCSTRRAGCSRRSAATGCRCSAPAAVLPLGAAGGGAARPARRDGRAGLRARPRPAAGRVFVVAWVATVGAIAAGRRGDRLRRRAPAGRAAPVVLVGRCSSPSPPAAGRALKGLVVGPLVAPAAVLAHRFGPRTAADGEPEPGPGRPGSRSRSCSSSCVLAAVGFAATVWRGGPVGYAFAGPLVAPTAAAGVLGTLVGIAVFVGTFALVVRLADRAASVVPRSGWRRVVAGLALGVVGAVVAAGTSGLADAGPDSWWIATTLISLDDGHRLRRRGRARRDGGHGGRVALARPAAAARRTRGPGSSSAACRGRAPARGPRPGRGAGRGRAAGGRARRGDRRHGASDGAARAGTGRAAGHR